MPRARRDQRSPEAQAYRKLYKTTRWQAIRSYQLSTEPLCRTCRAEGRATPATVCDHIEPHKGDLDKFFTGPFQSLCAPCHDGIKQSIERKGYSSAIGLDGWPTDERHPANKREYQP